MKVKNKERDDLIRRLYRKGDGAMLGRWWNISRQRVWQVVQNTPQKPQNGKLRGLLGSLIGWFKWQR